MNEVSSQVVVADPFRLPELVYAASGLAEVGSLRAYVAPVAFTSGSPLIKSAARLRAAKKLTAFAKLRELPPAIDAGKVKHAGAALDLGIFAAKRSGRLSGSVPKMMKRHGASFDRKVAGLVDDGDTLVVANRATAERTIHAARNHGAKSLLSYPIAHHAWAEAILGEEAELQPEFAPTLQYVAPSQEKADRIEREIELADALLCLSSFHAQTMISSGVPADKTVIAPLGVDLELFRPQRAVRDDIRRKTKVVFVGQLTQRKGISYLLEGFKRAALDDVELVFIGRPIGPAAALLNQPGVSVVPHVPRSQLPSLYATADLFVMPSLVEGFCMTAMEALACGVPTVVTPNTFGDEVVRDGIEGWNVPVRDPDAIAACIARVADPGFDWQAMSAAARKRAEQFSWTAFGRRFVEISRQLSNAA